MIRPTMAFFDSSWVIPESTSPLNMISSKLYMVTIWLSFSYSTFFFDLDHWSSSWSILSCSKSSKVDLVSNWSNSSHLKSLSLNQFCSYSRSLRKPETRIHSLCNFCLGCLTLHEFEGMIVRISNLFFNFFASWI